MSVVFITGCSSGFGLEMALAFARNGDTAIATMRNTAKAGALHERAEAAGVTVHVAACDVNDDASVASAVAEANATHGTIDVLVNNAGVAFGGPAETQPWDAARAVMETNFWGAHRMSRAVLPRMRAQRSGVIINVTSLAGLLPGALYTGMYAASKHALNALGESMAGELAPWGVRVHSIEPGFFATEITHNAEEVDMNAGPYAADAEWWQGFMNSSVDAGADPQLVADLCVTIAGDPASKFHNPIGADAEMYLALLDSVDDYDEWMATSLPVVEMTAGSRPTID